MIKSFNVIYQDINAQKFEPYDVMPYLVDEYDKAEDKPTTFEEFKEFVKRKSMYMYWSRCEYEIIIAGWPNTENQEKWDIHRQIMMNIDIVTNVLINNINGNYKEKNHS